MTTRTRRVWIVVGAIVGAIVALNLLARGLDRAVGGNEPGGVRGSSYATGSEGIAAYAALLTRFDHPVSQARGELAADPPVPDATVVVLEPSALTEDDANTLVQFASDGGRLVIGGQQPFYLRNLRDRPPQWDANGRPVWTQVAPSLEGVQTIVTAAAGSWRTPGSGEVLVGDPSESLLTRDHVGRGEIFFLADASPLENGYLARADNAAFGLALAGPAGRPVVFAEGPHGFGAPRGLGAIPTRWKFALAVFGAAVLAFVWSRARRFGPPDRASRDLPPARAEYVRALSITLERTRDPAAALAPVQQWARERLVTRTALRPGASDEEVARAARGLGCDEREVGALLAPVTNDDAALALGRVLARVDGGHGRTT